MSMIGSGGKVFTVIGVHLCVCGMCSFVSPHLTATQLDFNLSAPYIVRNVCVFMCMCLGNLV